MQTATVLIFFACCALSALSLAKDTGNYKPPSSMAPAHGFAPNTTLPPTTTKPTTTKPTTTKPTTTKPTTTKPTTTKPTTTKPTTTKPTTTKPTTTKPTTTKPTTTKPTTTKPTTTKPTTTKPMTTKPTTTKPTTTKPTTTKPTPPSPTPPTNVTAGNYILNSSKGEACLMAQMGLQIRLVSQKANSAFIVQQKETKTEGSCGDSTANLTISFKQGYITFLYNKSVSNNTGYVYGLSFSLSYPLGKNSNLKEDTYSAKNESLYLFPAKVGHSYSCKNESIFMGNGLYLEVTQDRMQAFNVQKGEFGSPEACPADRTDYRVAIAVGVTLAVLIVIVLVVYLLGRRKRTAGYQSL